MIRSKKEILEKINTDISAKKILTPALRKAVNNGQTMKRWHYEHQIALIDERIKVLKWMINES